MQLSSVCCQRLTRWEYISRLSFFPSLFTLTMPAMSDSPLVHRSIRYEINNTKHVYDLMPDETYESARRYLLATWGDDNSFYLVGED